MMKLFNQYFYSVFTSACCETTNHTNDSFSLFDPLCSLVITEAEVYNALIHLDSNKATGIDGIGPKTLKYCAMSLYRPPVVQFLLSGKYT